MSQVRLIPAKRLQEITDAAIAEGRHRPVAEFRTLCDGCRQWVSGIFHVSLGGVRLCKACAPESERKKQVVPDETLIEIGWLPKAEAA